MGSRRGVVDRRRHRHSPRGPVARVQAGPRHRRIRCKLHSTSSEKKKMATVTHRPRLPRRGLRGRGTPGSQVTCSAAAVTPSSSSDSPALEWPRKETRQKAEEWNDLRLEALAPGLPEVARALIQMRRRASSLLTADLRRLRSRLWARGRLRNSMPWPTPTPGRMKSRPSTSA